jgi:hypothetical protein
MAAWRNESTSPNADREKSHTHISNNVHGMLRTLSDFCRAGLPESWSLIFSECPFVRSATDFAPAPFRELPRPVTNRDRPPLVVFRQTRTSRAVKRRASPTLRP